MKKVFAFLSTILLTIAFVGLLATGVETKAATNKFTVDPTLAEDEIPVYIMDSIYTTFPNYYDNDAKADPKWNGPARMYPWNETRIRVAQFDENGQPTGKYYAVYFSGELKATDAAGNEAIGAGRNILFWNVDESGNVVAEKYADGKKASGGQASDPSLSHLRTNISGQDLTFMPKNVIATDEGTNFYNRSVVFNGLGQAVRGIGVDSFYAKGEGQNVFKPEYGYVNGEVKKIEAGDVVDKVMVQKVDEDGNGIVDENGDPVLEATDEDRMIYSRFVWEFFEEAPTNVNTVPYLSAGWDATLWDYVEEEKNEAGETIGYVAIAFVGSADNTAHIVKGEQLAVYTQTLIARGESEADAAAHAAINRTCVEQLRVPAGGFTLDYGYLDRGLENPDASFYNMVIGGYLNGRTLLPKKHVKGENAGEVVLDENNEPVMIGMAERKTYNFSVSPLRFDAKVIDGQSYQLLKGQNTVEVMVGTEFSPVKFINYSGVMRYWSVEDDFTSYKAVADALDLTITESFNGGATVTKVEPSNGYTSFEAVKEDFLTDFAAHKNMTVEEVKAKFGSAADFHSLAGWGGIVATNSDNAAKADYTTAFFNNNNFAMREKWGWLLEKIYQTMLAYPGGDTYTGTLAHINDAYTNYYCGSPQTMHYAIWYFLNGQQHAYFGLNFQDGHSSEWMDLRTNLDKWNGYNLDFTTCSPDDNYTVTFKAVNRETLTETSMTVKFVAVDSYTPIMEVNTGKLIYTPKKVMDSYVTDPINPYDIVKAYNAQYNGVSIKGNDISQRIIFDTELNWDAPQQGVHTVKATVYNNAGTKSATETFTVKVNDMVAPNVETRKVTIQYGDDFDARIGVVLAVDAVDGDLTGQSYKWCVQTSKAIDTTKVATDEDGNAVARKETVEVEIYDKAGNAKKASFILTIVPATTAVDGKVDALANEVKKLAGDVSDLLDQVYDLTELTEEEAAAVKAELTKVQTAQADAAASKKGCKSGAVIALAISAFATAFALVLRKKH